MKGQGPEQVLSQLVGISSRFATLLPSAQRSGIILRKPLRIFCKIFEEKILKTVEVMN